MFGFIEKAYQLIAEDNIWIPYNDRPLFEYSDGAIFESDLLQSIRSATDVSVFSPDLISKIIDWPSLYHLSSRRSNLLRPVLEHCVGPVLEVGAGCGAITRFLGEAGIETLALEGSPSRARIAAARCRDLAGIEFVVDTIQNFDPGPLFQTVILVGVLEYARVFFDADPSTDPTDAMLARLRSFMRPGGKLIIAIENQLGLKYFAGYPEDHLGERMVGIEDRYGPRTPVTFGRRELRDKLSRSGLPQQDWWFPFPDYKVPGFLLSERGLSDDVGTDFASLLSAASLVDPQRPATPLFSLQQAWPLIARNRLTGELANSFLVVASEQELPDQKNVAFYFNNGDYRHQVFNKSLRFYMEDNHLRVARSKLSTIDAGPLGVAAAWPDEAFHDGVLWQDRLVWIVNQPGWTTDHVVEWATIWWNFAVEKSGAPSFSPKELVPGAFIDAIPRNLIISGTDKYFIDQEWSVPLNIELGYLLYRSLLDAFFGVEFWQIPYNGRIYTIGELILEVSYGLGVWITASDIQRYHELECQFQSRVSGTALYKPRVSPHDAFIRLRPELNDLTILSERIGTLQTNTDSLRRVIESLNEDLRQAGERERGFATREQALVADLDTKETMLLDQSNLLSLTRQELIVSSSDLVKMNSDTKYLNQNLAETRRELDRMISAHNETHERQSLTAEALVDARIEIKKMLEEKAQLAAKLQSERDTSGALRKRLWRAERRWEHTAPPFTWSATHPIRALLNRILRVRGLKRTKRTNAAVILKSGLFDANFYCQTQGGIEPRDALRHFLNTGATEGRDPNAFFSIQWYMTTYTDVKASGINPLLHYIWYGAAENRRPGPDFDPRWYLEKYQDVASSGFEPLSHYLQHGRFEGRQTQPRSNDINSNYD